jgi:hypothetical protein
MNCVDDTVDCAGSLLLFVRDRARGGADCPFLPGIEVFSVQVSATRSMLVFSSHAHRFRWMGNSRLWM